MSKKLAGTLFIFNGNKYDYCYKEAIQCLLEFCDIAVVVAGGDDNTYEDIYSMLGGADGRIILIELTQEQWDNQHGQEKLNHFTNRAIIWAQENGYKYQFNLQADEIVHEKSYPEILKAVETDAEGFLVQRINLWQDPYHQLDVPQERKPCSTAIVRLARTMYRSYSDAESLGVPYADSYFYEGIRIYHTGFVRKREVMKDKIINMQCKVFEMADYDKKLDQCEVFNPKLWFDGDDLKVIDEPLPKLIQQWAKNRVYEDD